MQYHQKSTWQTAKEKHPESPYNNNKCAVKIKDWSADTSETIAVYAMWPSELFFEQLACRAGQCSVRDCDDPTETL